MTSPETTAHSPIGPSALHRLLACPGSYKLSRTKPQGGSSIYAAQGSVAHYIIEGHLSDDTVIEGPQLGDVVEEEGHRIEVDQEMIDGVNEMIAFCEPIKEAATKVWTEKRVHLDKLWLEGEGPSEKMFGTVDFGAYNEETGTLYCVDFKYGRLPVFPEDNPQQNAYGLGMIYELGHVPPYVVNVIIQPRGQDGQVVKIATMTGLDLLIWGHEVLKPGVEKLFESAPPLATGDHCRFCPAKIDCPALYALAKEAAKTDFSHVPPDPMTFDDAELAHVLNNAEIIAQWIEAVRAEASQRIEKGKTIPNWKLVPKKAMRRWDDPKTVEGLAEHVDTAWERKLRSPTQIEKADPEFYDALVEQGHVVKKSSGTTLVPDQDPREAVEGSFARDQFSVVEDD